MSPLPDTTMARKAYRIRLSIRDFDATRVMSQIVNHLKEAGCARFTVCCSNLTPKDQWEFFVSIAKSESLTDAIIGRIQGALQGELASPLTEVPELTWHEAFSLAKSWTTPDQGTRHRLTQVHILDGEEYYLHQNGHFQRHTARMFAKRVLNLRHIH
ncbi:hypothetical protein BJX64DRAFT_293442 [Aspergillus heterothallicus]